MDTYIRVIREIMVKHSGLEDANQFTDIDRFKFMAAAKGVEFEKMKDQ